MFSSLSPGDDTGLMTGNEAGDHGKKCFCAALLKRGGGGERERAVLRKC